MRDRTTSTAKHRVVRARIGSDEPVLAAVAVQLPGTASAAMSGAAAGATGGSIANDGPDTPLARSKAQLAEDFGVHRGHAFVVVLTSVRLLLVRRSAFGRLKEVVLDVPLEEVQELRISKPAQAVYLVTADGRELRLETPKAFKFLPSVYERLPALLADARSGE